ncbi:hypothetical protein FHX42_002893 [Saccharopolyspora lacisalsi]|uniref:Uncharacterized protein n=2 Tax=Halosaccharopolyspora lacisalsi TaxID=1000566 RepID=A0A839DU77_9PSEU|nr:hypothetical protein [Halosaccharopolyspora lacisalsi]
MNIGFGFFSTAWAVVITIAVTRLICSRITHERPLSAVMVMWLRELSAPRETVRARGGAASAARVRISQQRPRPKQARRSGKPRRSGRAKRSTQSQSTRGGGTSRSPSRSRRPAEGTRSAGRSPHSKEVRGVRSRARS